MIVIVYYKNKYCKSEVFNSGEDFMKYLKNNGTKIKDFEILQCE